METTTKPHPSTKPRTGGQVLVDQLIVHGVKQLFCVPGESYLAALDALHDAKVEVTICRQEGGATMMAEAQGKLTINHGPIKNLDMDGMTMVFKAGDAAMLKDLKAGTKIKFDADRVNGQITVTKLQKTK